LDDNPNASSESFEHFLQSIRRYSELLEQAKRYHQNLFERVRLNGEFIAPIASSRITYETARRNGESHEAIISSAMLVARASMQQYLVSSKRIIAGRLGRIERQYFKLLRRWRRLPIVTYGAQTEEAVREKRTALIPLFRRLDELREGNTFTLAEWETVVAQYLNGLDALKSLTHELSEDMVEWQKYVGDIWRLNTALTSAILAFIGLLFVKAYDEYHAFQREQLKPSAVTWVGDCAPKGPGTGFVCKFVSR
jgi:hypothetical protein